MTSTELERLIRERLETAGVLNVLDEYKSQFLEFPDGLFAELVLSDGSKLVEVERIGRELRESMKKKDIDLDVIVRSIWTVKEVGDPPYGNQLGTWRIPAVLASGTETRKIEVDVLYQVVEDVKNKIVGKGVDATTAIKEVVREFLEIELSLGGESYWDPIRYPLREINWAALSYLYMHTSVAQNLRIQG